MKIQSTEAKKGEIEFRRKLAQQQLGGATLIADELDKAAIEQILSERMIKTYDQISALRTKGVCISPYAEIYRVLTPGGSMFFDEEPFRKILHINLYVRDKSYSMKALNRGAFKKAMDYFFAAQLCNEVGHGIVENDQISLKEWKNAFKPFSERNVSLTSARYITTPMYPSIEFNK